MLGFVEFYKPLYGNFLFFRLDRKFVDNANCPLYEKLSLNFRSIISLLDKADWKFFSKSNHSVLKISIAAYLKVIRFSYSNSVELEIFCKMINIRNGSLLLHNGSLFQQYRFQIIIPKMIINIKITSLSQVNEVNARAVAHVLFTLLFLKKLADVILTRSHSSQNSASSV